MTDEDDSAIQRTTQDTCQLDMNVEGHFVRIFPLGKRAQYLCLDQGPLTLAHLLFRNGRPLHYRGSGLRPALGGYKRLLHAVLLLVYYRIFRPESGDLIRLPVTGQLCLHVRNGYKVFDFQRHAVTKIFLPEVCSTKVQNEIDWVKKIGVQELAPTVRNSDVKERWYEEDYVNGTTVAADDWQTLISLLAKLMLAFEPKEVSAWQYGLDRRNDIHGSTFCEGQFDSAKVTQMLTFVDRAIFELGSTKSTQICLVCSHGDFSASHALEDERGTIIIDWEAAAYRSALYDFYNTFFRRLRGSPESSVTPNTIDRSIALLVKQLSVSRHDQYAPLISSLESADLYRWIYYIEYIYSYVQKEKFEERHLNRILFFIGAFCRHEALRESTSAVPA
jgi:hypothetical protein